MSNVKDIGSAKNSLFRLVFRFEGMIFFVIISISMFIAIAMLVSIFANKITTDAPAEETILSKPEKDFVTLLEKSSDSNSSNIPAPVGRYSPFFEESWQ